MLLYTRFGVYMAVKMHIVMILGNDTVQSGKWLPTFRTKMLAPSSGYHKIIVSAIDYSAH